MRKFPLPKKCYVVVCGFRENVPQVILSNPGYPGIVDYSYENEDESEETPTAALSVCEERGPYLISRTAIVDAYYHTIYRCERGRGLAVVEVRSGSEMLMVGGQLTNPANRFSATFIDTPPEGESILRSKLRNQDLYTDVHLPNKAVGTDSLVVGVCDGLWSRGNYDHALRLLFGPTHYKNVFGGRNWSRAGAGRSFFMTRRGAEPKIFDLGRRVKICGVCVSADGLTVMVYSRSEVYLFDVDV